MKQGFNVNENSNCGHCDNPAEGYYEVDGRKFHYCEKHEENAIERAGQDRCLNCGAQVDEEGDTFCSKCWKLEKYINQIHTFAGAHGGIKHEILSKGGKGWFFLCNDGHTYKFQIGPAELTFEFCHITREA